MTQRTTVEGCGPEDWRKKLARWDDEFKAIDGLVAVFDFPAGGFQKPRKVFNVVDKCLSLIRKHISKIGNRLLPKNVNFGEVILRGEDVPGHEGECQALQRHMPGTQSVKRGKDHFCIVGSHGRPLSLSRRAFMAGYARARKGGRDA